MQGLIVSACFVSAVAGLELHVDKSRGNDATGTGSPSSPFGSLEHARDVAATLLSHDNVDLVLHGGLYVLNQTVDFTHEHLSGAAATGHRLTVRGLTDARGHQPVITSAVPVTGWQPVTGAAGIYWAPLPDPSIRQLFVVPASGAFVDGSRVNETMLGNSTQYGFTLLSSADTNLTEFGYSSHNAALIAALQRQDATCTAGAAPASCAGSVEFLYRMVGNQWTESRCKVQAWAYGTDAASGQAYVNVTMASPGWALMRGKMYPDDYPSTIVGLRSSLEGNSGFTDGGVPGTGYVSVAEKAVYYIPRPQDGNMSPSIVTVYGARAIGPLIRLSGQRNMGTGQPPVPVTGISFTGVTFAYAGWDHSIDLLTGEPCGAYAPDQSGIAYACSDGQADPGVWKAHATHPVPGAVEVHTGSQIVFSNCTWIGSGPNALVLDEGSQDSGVWNSTFLDTGCSAVRLAQVDDYNNTDPASQSARLKVSNNVIMGTGMEARDCAGIMSGYVLNSTVSHNSVKQAMWAGITLGWGWGDPARPTLGGNRILSNYVQYVNLLTADGGPIYVLGGQYYQSEFAYNYVGRAHHHAALVYHDEGSSHWYTHDNVVEQLPEDCVPNGGWTYVFLSAWAPSEHDIVIRDTTSRWLNVTHIGPGANITVTGTTIIGVNDTWPPAAQAVIDGAGPQ